MVLYIQTDKIDVFWILKNFNCKQIKFFFLLWSSSCDRKMTIVESNLKENSGTTYIVKLGTFRTPLTEGPTFGSHQPSDHRQPSDPHFGCGGPGYS